MSEMLEFAVKMSMLFNNSGMQGLSSASQAMQKMQNEFDKMRQASGKIGEYQKLRGTIEQTSQKLNAARERVRTLKEQMKQTPQPTAAMKREFTQANVEANRLSESLMSQRKHLGELGQSLSQAGINTRNLEHEQARLASQTDRLKAAQERLTAARSRYENIRSQLTWGNMQSDIMKSMGIIRTFQRPVQIGMEFDQAMAQVKAVASPSDSDFQRLRTQALELGSTTQFSATQAAQTQENLARGGFKPEQIIVMMRPLLNMAAAEGMDLAEAGGGLADVLGGMNYTADQVKRVTDVLANTSAVSNTNIAQVLEGLKVLAPVGSAQGMSIEQLGGYMAVLANKGFKGGEAGTAMSAMVLRLVTDDNIKELNQKGIAVKTKDGRLRELGDIMNAINEMFTRRKMGAADQLAYLEDIFGKTYAKVAQAFLDASKVNPSTGTNQVDELTRSNYQASVGEGKASQMAQIRNDTLKGDITSLSSAWEGLMIRISDALEPITRFITQTLTAGISKVTSFLNQHKELADWAIRIGTAFGAWKVVSVACKYMSLLLQLPFAKLGVWLAESAASTGAMAAGAGAASAGFWAMIWPIGLVIAGLVAMYYWWDDIKRIGLKIHEQWTALKNSLGEWGFVLDAAVVALLGPMGVLLDLGVSILGWWNELESQGLSMWDGIKMKCEEFSSWWSSWSLADIWQPVIDSFNSMLDWLYSKWQSFKDFFSSLNPLNLIPESAQTRQVNNATAALQGYMPAEIPRHASGGIMASPHFGLVAESCPEAIIPLRDKSRGIEVLNQAANLLGIPIPATDKSESVMQSGIQTISRYIPMNDTARAIMNHGMSILNN